MVGRCSISLILYFGYLRINSLFLPLVSEVGVPYYGAALNKFKGVPCASFCTRKMFGRYFLWIGLYMENVRNLEKKI